MYGSVFFFGDLPVISIFIMYSKDRAQAMEHTLSCLRDMPLYDSCQKMLIVDGKIDKIPQDWEAIQVPRINGKFCWGRMWDAGVGSALNDKIVYLDSDRFLPTNYLTLVNDKLKDDMFLFTSMHFMMVQNIPIEICKEILCNQTLADVLKDERSIGKLRYEIRHAVPHHGPGKNVMSGSTAFTKATYLRIGGVDHWYCGHGAFADSDFHMQAAVNECYFYDLEIPELHYPHSKEDKGVELKDQELWLLGLDNFIYYCRKWKLSMTLAKSLAVRCGITKPDSYIIKKEKEFMEASKE